MTPEMRLLYSLLLQQHQNQSRKIGPTLYAHILLIISFLSTPDDSLANIGTELQHYVEYLSL